MAKEDYAQMNIFANKLKESLSSYNFITFSDMETIPIWSNKHYKTEEFRNKYSNIKIFTRLAPIIILINTFRLLRKHKFKVIISTGPGIAISAGIAAKLFRVKIIHIETWSRFYSKSFTGRIMYKLADKFYVQNEELLKIYPKAIYSGRL